MPHSLELKDLHVEVDQKPILQGVSLRFSTSELHIVMGPNGSGKSTLSQVVMGHPKYQVTRGDILVDGKSILTLTPDKRAGLGLFLGFQYPRELPGVTYGQFLRVITNAALMAKDPKAKALSPTQFIPVLKKRLDSLGLKPDMISRSVNEGFSGGEKKRAEMLQLMLLEPRLAILDEIDSGLDVDALKVVAEGVKAAQQEFQTGVLLITHYQRVVDFLQPTQVSIMVDGKIVASGGMELVKQVEKNGYAHFQVK